MGQYFYLFISPPYKHIIIFDGNKDLDHIFDSLADRYRTERRVQPPELLIGPICSELGVPFVTVELHFLSVRFLTVFFFPSNFAR
jgi:hypothetical protein